jgi:WD40 repeat protein
MYKSHFKKLALLMVGCAALLLTLPRLLQSSSWNKPAMTPAWKVSLFPYGAREIAFTKDGKHLNAFYDGQKAMLSADSGKLNSGVQRLPRSAPFIVSTHSRFAAFHSSGVRKSTEAVQRLQHEWIKSTSPEDRKAITSGKMLRKPKNLSLWEGRRVNLLDGITGRLLHSWPLPDDTLQHQYNLSILQFTPDEKRLCAVTYHSERGANNSSQLFYQWWLWDTSSGQLLKTRHWLSTDSLHDGFGYKNKAFSADGQHLYTAIQHRSGIHTHNSHNEATGGLQLDDALTGKPIVLANPVFQPGWWANEWRNLTFSSNGKHVAAVFSSAGGGYILNGYDKIIHIWDFPAQSWQAKYFERGFITEIMQFSPNGEYLACGGFDAKETVGGFSAKGKLIVINVRDGRHIQTFSEEKPSDQWEQWRLSQTNRSASDSPQPARRFKPQYLPGSSGNVYALSWSPDSKSLAASYANGEIKLWRVP